MNSSAHCLHGMLSRSTFSSWHISLQCSRKRCWGSFLPAVISAMPAPNRTCLQPRRMNEITGQNSFIYRVSIEIKERDGQKTYEFLTFPSHFNNFNKHICVEILFNQKASHLAKKMMWAISNQPIRTNAHQIRKLSILH